MAKRDATLLAARARPWSLQGESLIVSIRLSSRMILSNKLQLVLDHGKLGLRTCALHLLPELSRRWPGHLFRPVSKPYAVSFRGLGCGRRLTPQARLAKRPGHWVSVGRSAGRGSGPRCVRAADWHRYYWATLNSTRRSLRRRSSIVLILRPSVVPFLLAREWELP